MVSHSKWRAMLLSLLFVVAATFAWQSAVAQDLFHDISGVVKKVDKSTKTIVVKTADGTEHTIKYTEKTTVEGAKDAEKGSAETYLAGKKGAKVTVHYTEKGTEKTAVGVKDAVD
jgi:VCBS repeat-containing protein